MTDLDGTPDNVLFEWYERYIGDPETETDVYLGFADVTLVPLEEYVVGSAVQIRHHVDLQAPPTRLLAPRLTRG